MNAERHSQETANPAVTGTLSDRDRAILEFERQWWKYAGAKESAVREQFDMSATRYYQVLNALVERAGVDPALVDDVIWVPLNPGTEQRLYAVPGTPVAVSPVSVDEGV